MKELDHFLRNHVLKILPDKLQIDSSKHSKGDESTSDSRVVFGVSTEILTALISLQIAVERSVQLVSAKARYWSEITAHLVNIIESELSTRPDLNGYLEKARLKADPSSMEPFINV